MKPKEKFIFLFKAYLKQAEADVKKWAAHLERLEGKPDIPCKDELSIYRDALKVYADIDGGIWELCPDDKEDGLRRCFITGTTHPNYIARKALGID